MKLPRIPLTLLLLMICFCAEDCFCSSEIAAPIVSTNPCLVPVPPSKAEKLTLIEANEKQSRLLGDKIRLIFEGDSITHNWSSRGKDVWKERYEPLGAFNFGVGGDKTENILWRIQRGQLDGLHPKLVVLTIGTNNLNGKKTPEQVAEGIAAIIKKYQEHCPGVVILLQGVFPRGHDPADPLRSEIKDLNALISRFADGNKVLYIDFGEKFLEPDGSISPQMMHDYLHPESKGYQIWADSIAPIIGKYFPESHS